MHHRCDLPRFIMRHLRVAETREIAQREPVADREEIQASRTPRSLAGPREAFYSGQCVEERALAHVGSSRDGNLGTLPSRASAERERGKCKFCGEACHGVVTRPS